MKHFITVVSIIAVLAFPVGAMAGSATKTFKVSVETAGGCIFEKADDMKFDTYYMVNDATGQSDITHKCTQGVRYKLYISGDRVMKSTTSAEKLNFELYTDTNRTIKFPENNSSAGPVTVQNNDPIKTTAYGKVPANQLVSAPATFEQILTANVDW